MTDWRGAIDKDPEKEKTFFLQLKNNQLHCFLSENIENANANAT